MRIILGTEAKIPELFAEFWCILVKKARQGYLQRFNVRLGHRESDSPPPLHAGQEETYKSGAFEQIETQFHHDVVLVAEDV